MTAKLKNGLTVLAHKDGYAKTFANRTQANQASAKLPGSYVWQGTGRPFYVVIPKEAK